MIYVIDSNDHENYEEAAEELHGVMQSDEMPRDAVFLLFGNKQDLWKAKPMIAVAEALKIRELRGRAWYVQAACATSGDGLFNGFQWLAKEIKKRGM